MATFNLEKDTDFVLTDTQLHTLGIEQLITFSSGELNLTIPEESFITNSLNAGIIGIVKDVNVTLDITHSYNEDLSIYLTHGEKTVLLMQGVGGSDDDFSNTTLDDEASTSITNGISPFIGIYKSQGKLSVFDGSDLSENWTLKVTDTRRGDVGALNSWSLGISAITLNTEELVGVDSVTLTGGESNNILDASAFTGSLFLYGKAGNDILNAGSGNVDFLEGGAGDDVLNGGVGVFDIASYETAAGRVEVNLNLTDTQNTINAGYDTLIDIEVLFGSDYNDILIGNGKNNGLYGRNGDDVLNGLGGDDFLSGNNGNDVYFVDSINDVVIEKFNQGIDTVKSLVNWTLDENVEKLSLLGADNINAIGNDLANTLLGNSGDNILKGNGGNDILKGGAGNDTYLFGIGSGADKINDWSGNNDQVVLSGLSRNAVSFEAVNNAALKLIVNATGESLYINRGASNINGDGIELFKFIDVTLTKEEALNSRAGVTVTRISDNENTREGNFIVDNDNEIEDSVFYLVKLTSAPIINHAVTINFTSTDKTEGRVKNASLTFNANNWNQNQTFSVQGIDDLENDGLIAYTIKGEIDQQKTTALEYLTINIETQVLANENDSEDIPLNDINSNNIGTKGVDYMVGSNSDDQLYASYGFDEIRGGYGDDLLYGEGGNDRLYGAQGNDKLYGGYQLDKLYGGDGNDKLYGEQDDDYLNGGAGNDWLDGGLGADIMVGGAGNDVYIIDDRDDVVNDWGVASDIDTVHVKVTASSTGSPYTYILAKNIEKAVIKSLSAGNLIGNGENNLLIGNGAKNILKGGWGKDTLNGGAGSDTLNGGKGSDIMKGGTGDDIYIVNSSVDKVIEISNSSNGGFDTVKASANFTLTKNIEKLVLTGATDINAIGNGLNNIINGNKGNNIIKAGGGADKINSGSGNDKVIAGAGNDIINAGSGNDIINGGSGRDILTGGKGQDKFQLTTKIGIDVIKDFVVTDDTIQLENSVFSSLGAMGTIAQGKFKTGAKALDNNDYLIYTKATGALFYDADGAGGVDAIQIALLGQGLSLTHNDFMVI